MKLRFIASLVRNRELIWRLTERDVIGRYRGSLLGWGWTLVNPLLMLGVYTFVFSEIFKARWSDSGASSGTLGFAINLFAGLIVFNLFSECVNQSPSLVIGNPSYVTKVIFPLDALSAVTVGTALFHAFTSVAVLVMFQFIAGNGLSASMLWLPIAWIPLLLGCLAISWFLAAMGVFLRDIGQVTGVATSMLMFLSAVFYPVSALPSQWQPLLQINPLVQVIEQTRRITVQGEAPGKLYLLIGITATLLACELSFRSFCRARRGFADVI
jgi:lipopolysaccharide transport system permease protein